MASTNKTPGSGPATVGPGLAPYVVLISGKGSVRSVSISNVGYWIVQVLGLSAGPSNGQALTRNEAVEALGSIDVAVRIVGVNGDAADRVEYNQGATYIVLVVYPDKNVGSTGNKMLGLRIKKQSAQSFQEV